MGVYLWHDDWWTPWANTIAYYPFVNDTADQMGNITLTSPSAVQQTLWFRITGGITGTRGVLTVNYIGWWYKPISGTSSMIAMNCIDSPAMGYYYAHTQSNLAQHLYAFWPSYNVNSQSAITTFGNWYHIAVSYNSTENKTYGYLNGVEYLLYNWQWSNLAQSVMITGSRPGSGSTTSGNAVIDVSEVILEDTARSGQQVLDYYNSTKSKYWIS